MCEFKKQNKTLEIHRNVILMNKLKEKIKIGEEI